MSQLPNIPPMNPPDPDSRPGLLAAGFGGVVVGGEDGTMVRQSAVDFYDSVNRNRNRHTVNPEWGRLTTSQIGVGDFSPWAAEWEHMRFCARWVNKLAKQGWPRRLAQRFMEGLVFPEDVDPVGSSFFAILIDKCIQALQEAQTLQRSGQYRGSTQAMAANAAHAALASFLIDILRRYAEAHCGRSRTKRVVQCNNDVCEWCQGYLCVAPVDLAIHEDGGCAIFYLRQRIEELIHDTERVDEETLRMVDEGVARFMEIHHPGDRFDMINSTPVNDNSRRSRGFGDEMDYFINE